MSAFRSTRNFYDTVMSWLTNNFTTNPDEVPPSITVVATVADEVTAIGARGTFTDRSGTITVGGASQQVMAANADRKYLLFVNSSDEIQWINFGGDAVATQPSIPIQPQGSFVMESGFINTGALHVIGATTGKIFTAKEG